MGTHPNVILLCTLTPQGLSRKTRKDILAETDTGEDDDIKIGNINYHHEIMESDYHESWQISAREGDIIVFSLVTYGYGESIDWENLLQKKEDLEAWAVGVCERHHCQYKISVTANYW